MLFSTTERCFAATALLLTWSSGVPRNGLFPYFLIFFWWIANEFIWEWKHFGKPYGLVGPHILDGAPGRSCQAPQEVNQPEMGSLNANTPAEQ